MGFTYADITLSNPGKPHLKPMAVRAMVDTGAMMLCIPEHIAVQLQLEEFEKREVTTADESRHVVSHVGPILIRFDNRHSITGALVIGNSVLLGAIALQDMDVVISPTRETIIVNPESPNIPSAIVK
ncbi:MAG: clan AA aspartic protease [Planctomycetes bacterium]|nr:clan AA aspartic protease [Planctomycetota bacterium]